MKVLIALSTLPDGNGGFYPQHLKLLIDGIRLEHETHVVFISDSVTTPDLLASCLVDEQFSAVFSEWQEDLDIGIALLSEGLITKASRTIHAFQPDIIHCFDWLAWLTFRYHSTKITYSLSSSVVMWPSWSVFDKLKFQILQLEKEACARAALLIVPSEKLRSRVWYDLCGFAAPISIPFLQRDYPLSKRPVERIVFSYFGSTELAVGGLGYFLESLILLDERKLKSIDVEFNIFHIGELVADISNRRLGLVKEVQEGDFFEVLSKTHVLVIPRFNDEDSTYIHAGLRAGCFLLCPQEHQHRQYLRMGENYLPIEPSAESVCCQIENILQNQGKYLGRELEISGSAEAYSNTKLLHRIQIMYSQVWSGRELFNNWGNGLLAQISKEKWQLRGDQRKAGLLEIFTEVAPSIRSGLVLVCGTIEPELISYQTRNNKLVPHTFFSREGRYFESPLECISLQTDLFDYSVAVYVLEFLANPKMALFELWRVTKSAIIVGISHGPNSFGQMTPFLEEQEFQAFLENSDLYSLDRLSSFPFIDSVGQIEKEMVLFRLSVIKEAK